MKRVKRSELSEPVRSFLERLNDDESIMVEDDNGRLRCGITPYMRASDPERQRAWREIHELQDKVAASLATQGVTEEDVDRLLQEDE